MKRRLIFAFCLHLPGSLCCQIREIEAEINRTQKNKATNYHIGLLKAKLSKLRSELLEGPKGSGKGSGEGFDVMKSGDARVALIGFPSVGKVSRPSLPSLQPAASRPCKRPRHQLSVIS